MSAQNVDRRNFLKGMAVSGMAAAAAGVSLAYADEKPEGEGGPEGEGEGQGQGGQGEQEQAEALPPAQGMVGGAICPEDWLGAAPSIADDQIVAEYDYDVVVLGCGHAGAQAGLAAAQEGVSVAMVEAQEEDSYMAFGDDTACYNSQFAIDHGYGPYDTSEIVAEYVRRGGGRANVDLIKKYVENSGETFDNLVSIVPETSNVFDLEGGQCIIQHAYGKESGEDYPLQIAGYKCWATTVQTGGTTNPTPVFGREGVSRMTELELYTIHAAIDLGAQMFWGTKAVVLVQDGDAVTGAIVEAPEGYVKLNAAKGVILACGDFSGNADMVWNLLDEVAEWGGRNGEERQRMAGFGRDGMGIKLGCWAGGGVQPHPRPTMDGKIPGAWHTTPFLFLNSAGDRFMNESMAQLIEPHFRKQPAGNIAIITDSKFMETIELVGVDHGAPNWGKPELIYRMERYMLALEAGPEGGSVPGTDVVNLTLDPDDNSELGEHDGSWVVKANTIEELVEYLGYEGEARDAALAAIARYNELCYAGHDDDYGKEDVYMKPIDEPPFYACFDDNKKDTRAGLVCLTGLSADGNLNVLKANHLEPIPGLYAAGNTLGERYGNGYVGCSAGNSIGMAMTHGRVAGKIVAAL